MPAKSEPPIAGVSCRRDDEVDAAPAVPVSVRGCPGVDMDHTPAGEELEQSASNPSHLWAARCPRRRRPRQRLAPPEQGAAGSLHSTASWHPGGRYRET
eukprot:4741046-Lingulodinium_polyedra.AAC.1